MSRRSIFIMYHVPSWINDSNLMRYLPELESGIIAYASLRCPILLATDSLANRLCVQRDCYPAEVGDAIRRFITSYIDKLKGVSMESVNKFLNSIEEIISRYEPTICEGIETLGCYISKAPNDIPGYEDLGGNPLIVINVDRISDVIDDILNSIGDLRRYYSSKELKENLLKSVIAHEVTHSFTDTAHDNTPKRRLSKQKNKFYYKVIEESLATYYEIMNYLRIREGPIQRYIMDKLLQESSIEYRAGLVWYLLYSEYFRRSDIDYIISLWSGLHTSTSGIYIEVINGLSRVFRDLLTHSVSMYELRSIIREICRFHSENSWKLLATVLVLKASEKPYFYSLS